MICVYTSSKDDAKTSPLFTLICAYIFVVAWIYRSYGAVAFINKLLPFDPQHPRLLRLHLGPESGGKVVHSEYDTEESAAEWRRELTGMSHS